MHKESVGGRATRKECEKTNDRARGSLEDTLNASIPSRHGGYKLNIYIGRKGITLRLGDAR